MKVHVVSRHVPDPHGTAAGRALTGLALGLRELGHDVTVTSWRPEPPDTALPSWCEWRPLGPEPRWRTRARALVRPRADSSRVALGFEPDTVAVADDPLSFAAVRGAPSHVVTFHYATRLDAAACGRRSLRDVQDRRAELHAARTAAIAHAYSSRVAAALDGRPDVVPIAYPGPFEPLAPVERPIAALVADWGWAPNAVALDRLLSAWPTVRESIPSARLVLAGRGAPGERVGVVDGVELLGPVADSLEVLARAAVVAFPCPPTSGPKVKVLEAMAAGRAVVTTPAGVEGIDVDGSCALVAADDGPRFTDTLVAALRDPAACADMGRRAAAAVALTHAPLVAARRRVARWSARAGAPA